MKKILFLFIIIINVLFLSSCEKHLSKNEMDFIYNIYINNINKIDGFKAFDFLSDNYYTYNAEIISTDDRKIVDEKVEYYLELSNNFDGIRRRISKFTCERNACVTFFDNNAEYYITMKSEYDGKILSQSLSGYKKTLDTTREIINEKRYYNIVLSNENLQMKYNCFKLIPAKHLFSYLITNNVEKISKSYKYQKEFLKEYNVNNLYRGGINETINRYKYPSLFNINIDLDKKCLVSCTIGDNYDSISKMYLDNKFHVLNIQRIYNYVYKNNVLVNPIPYHDINYINDWTFHEDLNVFSYILSDMTSYMINEQFTKSKKKEITAIEDIDTFSSNYLYNEYIVDIYLVIPNKKR